MRAISLVNRIEFEFPGNVVRNALTFGDVDNDGYNELVVGNQSGDVAIFKGKERIQTIPKLTCISCVAVGDILNQNRNVLVIVTGDGWCYLYSSPEKSADKNHVEETEKVAANDEQLDVQIQSTSASGSLETTPNSELSGTKKTVKEKSDLVCIHMQRIPANAKCILLGDIDGDGSLEMVLGLTDRVVRSYRWISNPHKPDLEVTDLSFPIEPSDKMLGKFIALNKWECANQIGSITLHHSLDGTAFLLIAQPGGTFMRIRCQADDSSSLGGIDSSQQSNSNSSLGDNIPGSTIDYQSLGISRMRNQNISTEILGDIRRSSDGNACIDNALSKGIPYALATLDGTIMLVQDEIILWAFAIDHQVFALTKLDVTGNGSDDIVVCCWDGQTYILDQDKNSVRFHLDEAVQAFDCGHYYLSPAMPNATCLVYITFKNTIMLYYDITLKELTCRKFEPNLEKLAKIMAEHGETEETSLEKIKNMDKKTKKELVGFLLYGVH